MEWIRGKTIGHGSFASVSLAIPTTHTSPFPPLVALKSCALSHSACLMKERLILEELKDCPHLIRCYGDSFTIENGQKLYNVALEYASGGSIADKLKHSRNSRLSEDEVRRYTNSILKGLQFIHRNGYVHCDVKLQNILLVSDGGNDAAKIADFGLAKRAAAESDSKYEIRGTPMYMAPETVVAGEQESASDIWAVGCLVAEMVTGRPAWTCSDIGALFLKIGVGAEIPEIPGKLSEAGKDFLRKCLMKDPRKRWTAEMLLNHPFLNLESLKEEAEDESSSISPRDPFDFPDWEWEQSCLTTPLSSPEYDPCVGEESEFSCGSPSVSPATRLQQLGTDERQDWCVSSNWFTVR